MIKNIKLNKTKWLSEVLAQENSKCPPQVHYPNTIIEYFSELEILLEKIFPLKQEESKPIKQRELESSLIVKRLDQRISAYFELDLFNIFEKAGLNPIFSDSWPDLKITLSNKSNILIECTVCQWFETKEKKLLNQANYFINKMNDQAVKYLQSAGWYTTDEFSALKISIIYFKGAEFNSNERNEIIKFLLEIHKSSKEKTFTTEKIKFVCELLAPPNRNLTCTTLPSNLKKTRNAFLESLNTKKPKRETEEPYIIAICLWGWEGMLARHSSRVRKNDFEISQLEFVNDLTEFFKDNHRICGVFLFPDDWFPIAGTTYINNENILQITQFTEQVISKPNLQNNGWLTSVLWDRKKRNFIFFKNSHSILKVSPLLENSLLKSQSFHIHLL